MKLIIVLILCISAGLTAGFRYPNSIPDESCDCRLLSTCHSVLSKLKASYTRDSIRHKAFIKYLDAINCGFIRHEPLVCCPQEIPGEVAKLLDNKKLWTKYEEPKSIKKLKLAIAQAKESIVSAKVFDSAEQLQAEFVQVEDQFPDCGRYLWREDSYGNLTMLGEYPWLALLEYETPKDGKKFLCGGALISDQHILTAARCVTTRGSKLTSVILGEYDTNANPECMDDGGNEPICVDSVKRYDIGSLIVHDEYNDGISHRGMEDGIHTMDGPDSLDFGPELHDIALIKLKEKVQFTDYIQPICLPSNKPKIRRYKVAGWGKSLYVPDNKGSNQKLMAYLTQCRHSEINRPEIGQNYDKNEHICAGITSVYRDEKPCIGDSGGPLMAPERKENGVARMTVFGVSYMETNCELPTQPKNLPGIYTNVYNYKDWIVKHMYS